MGTTIQCSTLRIEGVDLMVFDKDGTLIDIHTYWAGMIGLRADILARELGLKERQRMGLMSSMGVDTDAMRIKPEGPVGIKKREMVLAAGAAYLEGQGYSEVTGVMDMAFGLADRMSLERLDLLIRPLDGMVSLLETLQDRGCRVAIATTDLADRARLAFEHLQALQLIDFIAGADMVTRPKPAGDILELICSSLKIPLANTVMVGDAPADVLAGQNAGCRASVAVASGMTCQMELQRLTPYVVPGISSIEVAPK